MSSQGGVPGIEDVLRQLGREAVIREAENAGLKPRNGRMRCPFVGCRDKLPEKRSDSAAIYPGKRGEPRIRCFICGQDGSLVDMLAALRGWSEVEAIRHLKGLPAPASKPALRLVQPEPPPAADKLTPEQVRALWEKLVPNDPEGRAYLEGRGLADAIELGFVRFVPADHPDSRMKYWWRDKRIVAALMKDVVGNYRGLQGRLIRPLKPGEKRKCIGFKGTWNKKAFFGSPELIESSPLIAVAEGLPDFLALAGWARGHQVVTVGAAGIDSLPSLAEELKRCDIPLEGRIFALFPQNDVPLNKSRAAFDRLGQMLHQQGARVVMVSVPDPEKKDLADWLQATPDAEWPPAALAEVLGGNGGDLDDRPKLLEPARGNLPIPERVKVDVWGQNLSTLVALLDDPLHREALTGKRGELAYNEMSGEIDFCGKELDDTDVTHIRIRIEQHAKTPEGKTLKFKREEVWDALTYLSKRRRIHPIRDWLTSLKWDGLPRLASELPRAFGYDDACLEAVMLEKWFVSAAARGIEPGCKVDTVLVLQGDEGIKKSTFFEILAGRKLFTASPVHIGEADGFSVLRHKWIVEWAELDSMKRARDQQSIKAFLSSPEDFYRPKWGRGHINVPRSCVIVGTTNEPRFLQEAQGNRRFWPVRVHKLDFVWLREHREQLLAEAVARFLGAPSCEACRPLMPIERCDFHKWWLEDELVPVLREHNAEFQEADEWVNVIADWIKEQRDRADWLGAVRVHDVLEKAIGKPPGQWGPRDPNRAAEALKRLGWAKFSRRRFKGKVGSWWVPPGFQAPLADLDDGVIDDG